MHNVINALDALALALTTHDHVWTERERQLYEEAVDALSAACRKSFGLSASAMH